MSYEFYKILHILGIVLFFSQYAVASSRAGKNLPQTILTGIALVFIIVSGMGLLARTGVLMGAPWPLWVKMKLGIWTVLGVTGHMVLRRFHGLSKIYFWFAFALLGTAAYLALTKLA